MNLATNGNKKIPKKSPKIFECIPCCYTCSNKKDFTKHISTQKHNRQQMATKSPQKSPYDFSCESCGKGYKSRAGLWRHKKICEIVENENLNFSKKNNIHIEENELMNNDHTIISDLKNLIIQQEENHRRQMNELIPKIGNTNNTITNEYNINLFLNNECKDALNLTDFISQLTLKMSNIEQNSKLGYVEGVSKLFINGLDELEINKRPIHCGDSKNEVLYVKENNIWNVDDQDNIKMRNAIEEVTKNNIKQISSWVDNNPGCMETGTNENKTYIDLISNNVSSETDDKDIKQIIKNIAKEVAIDSNYTDVNEK